MLGYRYMRARNFQMIKSESPYHDNEFPFSFFFAAYGDYNKLPIVIKICYLGFEYELFFSSRFNFFVFQSYLRFFFCM